MKTLLFGMFLASVAPTPSAFAQEQSARTPLPPATQDGFFVVQQADQMLVSNLLNAVALNTLGEDIGRVSDVLMNNEGQAIGLVVGVGGFLGIGEHNVAIDIGQIEFVMFDDIASPAASPQRGWATGGRLDHVRVPSTREQLEAAPNFVSIGY